MGRFSLLRYWREDPLKETCASGPISMTLELTRKCNARCLYCEVGQGRVSEKEELSSQEIFSLLEEARDNSILELGLTGGEPFLREEVWEIFRFCSTHGIRIIVATNGLVISGSSEGRLRLLRDPLHRVRVSLDSANPARNDRLRGVNGYWEYAMEAVRKLRGGNVGLTTVLSGENIDEVPELVRLASGAGAKELIFQLCNFSSNFPDLEGVPEKEGFLLRPEQEEAFCKKIREGLALSLKLGLSSNLHLLMHWALPFFRYARTEELFFHHVGGLRKFRCFIPFIHAYVTSSGGLLPCIVLPEVGNIRGSSLIREWKEKLAGVKASLLREEYYPQCRSCFCHFPTNYRYSLRRFPLFNWQPLLGMAAHRVSYRSRRLLGSLRNSDKLVALLP